ncbi:reverse transcriptase zinc-binding domain-containing protein [Tanacetum coccineum]|uniref:Reverse transcriptase zinc-binding domain-containing protein n=1 Tax=Tanacetum coccineum TaxID=301880 RepID=A0ABQ5A0R1_9ASTR
MINNGQWKWPYEWNSTYNLNLPNSVPSLSNGVKDMILWEANDGKCYNYSTNRVWKEWRDKDRKVVWSEIVWFFNCTPKHSFIMWMVVQGRLSTQERLMKWYPEKQLRCSLCGTCLDSLNHLFFECQYSNKIWSLMKKKSSSETLPDKWEDILATMTQLKHNRSIKSVLRRIIIVACVYFIWNERNKRLFTNDKRDINDLSGFPALAGGQLSDAWNVGPKCNGNVALDVDLNENMRFTLFLVMPSIRASMFQGRALLNVSRVFVKGNVARIGGLSMAA